MREATYMTPAARKILDTASHLFYWKGIHAIGVETIAKEAGVTKKTLYDRFGSKDQLIVAYLHNRDALWKDHINQYVNNVSDKDPLSKILSIYDALESWLQKQDQRGCAFVNALAELAEPTHPGRNVIMEEKQWLKQLFATYLVELGVPNTDDISEQLLVLHEGLTVTNSMKLSPNGFTSVKQTAKLLIGVK
ncbi:TetR/AcrR family transcriptional regulator [Pontibacillus salicampi]|uniref:TetR/AcrR family transcriptional regulator n=1 Tax=Pontibacillus salicampi TaxID=1449801 RepID=A0ABV6LKL8_9BACI